MATSVWKLAGLSGVDIARVKAVRAARPGVWMGVDANQGYSDATGKAWSGEEVWGATRPVVS